MATQNVAESTNRMGAHPNPGKAQLNFLNRWEGTFLVPSRVNQHRTQSDKLRSQTWGTFGGHLCEKKSGVLNIGDRVLVRCSLDSKLNVDFK